MLLLSLHHQNLHTHTFTYCDGNILSSSEGILFECPSGPKIIKISEDMPLDALRKTIMDAIGGCKILLDLFLPPTCLCKWWLC